MSNAIFPVLPGLKWGVGKMPIHATSVKKSASQRRTSMSFASYPIWRFRLEYEVLRANVAYGELQQLVGFFNNRRGSWDAFLYSDPNDKSVIDQVVAITVSGQTRYRLNRTFGGFTEPVGAVNGTPTIKLAGATQSGSTYTIDENAYLTFNSAPTAGLSLTWTGNFYHRVAFTRDEGDFEEFMRDLWTAKKIEFETVKT